MQATLPADAANLDFYTAPDTVPKGLNGSADCVISAGICLQEVKPALERWDAVSRVDPTFSPERPILHLCPRPEAMLSLLPFTASLPSQPTPD